MTDIQQNVVDKLASEYADLKSLNFAERCLVITTYEDAWHDAMEWVKEYISQTFDIE